MSLRIWRLVLYSRAIYFFINPIIASIESLDCSNMDSYFMDIKIRKKILCDYDKNIRPQQERVDVVFDYIFKTFDFTSSKNLMTVQSWITLKWNDSRLSWNPEQYDKESKTFTKFDMLWIPDISLMGS